MHRGSEEEGCMRAGGVAAAYEEPEAAALAINGEILHAGGRVRGEIRPNNPHAERLADNLQRIARAPDGRKRRRPRRVRLDSGDCMSPPPLHMGRSRRTVRQRTATDGDFVPSFVAAECGVAGAGAPNCVPSAARPAARQAPFVALFADYGADDAAHPRAAVAVRTVAAGRATTQFRPTVPTAVLGLADAMARASLDDAQLPMGRHVAAAPSPAEPALQVLGWGEFIPWQPDAARAPFLEPTPPRAVPASATPPRIRGGGPACSPVARALSPAARAGGPHFAVGHATRRRHRARARSGVAGGRYVGARRSPTGQRRPSAVVASPRRRVSSGSVDAPPLAAGVRTGPALAPGAGLGLPPLRSASSCGSPGAAGDGIVIVGGVGGGVIVGGVGGGGYPCAAARSQGAVGHSMSPPARRMASASAIPALPGPAGQAPAWHRPTASAWGSVAPLSIAGAAEASPLSQCTADAAAAAHSTHGAGGRADSCDTAVMSVAASPAPLSAASRGRMNAPASPSTGGRRSAAPEWRRAQGIAFGGGGALPAAAAAAASSFGAHTMSALSSTTGSRAGTVPNVSLDSAASPPDMPSARPVADARARRGVSSISARPSGAASPTPASPASAGGRMCWAACAARRRGSDGGDPASAARSYGGSFASQGTLLNEEDEEDEEEMDKGLAPHRGRAAPNAAEEAAEGEAAPRARTGALICASPSAACRPWRAAEGPAFAAAAARAASTPGPLLRSAGAWDADRAVSALPPLPEGLALDGARSADAPERSAADLGPCDTVAALERPYTVRPAPSRDQRMCIE